MNNIGILSLLRRVAFVAIAASLAAPWNASIAHACADLIYPSHLGTATLDSYDVIAIVAIEKITPLAKDSWYAPPFKFSGKVRKAIKGSYKTGELIFGETGGPRPGAACPISLIENKSYLLFFNGTRNPITLARYGSYFQAVGDAQHNQYVTDLEVLLKKQKNAR